MSSLVRDFQRDLVQSSKSTTELLRTAKLISAKLGLNDISSWIAAELSGYRGDLVAPAYRVLSGGDLQVFNPYHGWRFVGHVSKKFAVGQSVSEIEELLKQKSIVLPLKGHDRFEVHDSIGRSNDNEQQLLLSSSAVRQILDSVRDRLLDWSSELESRGILGFNMTFDSKEQESAKNQVFHIQNFTGVFGSVTNSSVQVYDYSSVHQILRDKEVPQVERNELENIMDDLKKATPEKKSELLERAKNWIAKNADFLGASISIVRRAMGLGDSAP